MTRKHLVDTQFVKLFSEKSPFVFENGAILPEITVAYETYGKLNAAGDNAVLVIHALTGSAHAAYWNSPDEKDPGWWHNFIGDECPLDPKDYFIICPNLLSSCYGTSGPSSINPASGHRFGLDFPATTTRDMVNVQRALLKHLKIEHLFAVVGGSLGAMQVWQWMVQYPNFMDKALPIAGSAKGSPWMIALNEVARTAIYNDPAWPEGVPTQGLHTARMLGMITYRTHEQYSRRFARTRVDETPAQTVNFDNFFQVESYLHYQGDKLVKRFDAHSYVYLTKAMDFHDISRGFPSWSAALERIQARTLVLGISSDILYYPDELRQTVAELQQIGKNIKYDEIQSIYGHDAFLIEYDKLNPIVTDFLKS